MKEEGYSERCFRLGMHWLQYAELVAFRVGDYCCPPTLGTSCLGKMILPPRALIFLMYSSADSTEM